jgi:hypothetical protein
MTDSYAVDRTNDMADPAVRDQPRPPWKYESEQIRRYEAWSFGLSHEHYLARLAAGHGAFVNVRN